MINFTNIRITGFGSMIKETEFKLDRDGLNIISGKVGSGKTTIPSALVWCLYGHGLKGKATVPTWEELRPDDWKGTKVEVDLEFKGNKYTIIRCHTYKGKVHGTKGAKNLFVIKNGKPTDTKGKGGKQEEVEKLIGYSYTLFINAIVFGQRMKRIIDESGPNKKKIFEEAFEVTFIEEAKKQVTEKNKDVQNLANEYGFKIDKIEDRIEYLEDNLESTKKYEELFTQTKKEKIKDLKAQIKRIKKPKFAKLNIQDIAHAEAQVTSAREYWRLMDRIKVVEAEEAKLEAILRIGDFKKCETCGQKLTKLKAKKLEKQIYQSSRKLKKEADELREKQFLFPSAITEKKAQAELDRIHQIIRDSRVQAKIWKEGKDLKVELEKKIAREKKNKLVIKSTSITNKIKLAKKRLARTIKKKDKLNEVRDLNNWLIKEPLSNTGIKAYIFDSLLGKVNDRLNEYADIIGFNIEFGIDLESARKDFYQVITKNGIIIIYEDLSGGQKQLVDTCIALAIHSVISSVRPVNLIFLDEPFEGLDDETIEVVSDLIVKKAEDKCLYLITHHGSFNPITANKIYFKLNKKGATRVT